MSEQGKPFREYWLGQTTMLKNGVQSHVEFLIERNHTHGLTHVVEYSALEQAQARIAELQSELDRRETYKYKLAMKNLNLKAQLSEEHLIFKENEKLKADLKVAVEGVELMTPEELQKRIEQLEAVLREIEKSYLELSLVRIRQLCRDALTQGN